MSSGITTYTAPLTLLQAVNEMLAAVGQAAITTLDSADHNEESRAALSHISTTALAVQSEGWHCNTEEALPVEPEVGTGHIYLPQNVIRHSLTAGRSHGRDLTQRGRRLYDRDGHTFEIGETVYVDVTLGLPFEDLPQSLRWYITAKAARLFAVGRVHDTSTFRFTKSEEDDARSLALQDDQEARGTTAQDTSPHFFNQRRRR